MEINPGIVVLFGSGEAAPSAQRVYDWVMQRLTEPIRVAILETPAGFELNSPQVAGRIGQFLVQRLQNYAPQVDVLPARKKGTEQSPDNADILSPMLAANMMFMGPGSPTYNVRQLDGSLAWKLLRAKHLLGASVALASAATISIGRLALPVYEIYKVGEDVHWKEGLDLFAAFGLDLVFVPHWNNNDGGEELDTTHCFMGAPRFEDLREMLPTGQMIVGIDEHTALMMTLAEGCCHILGAGGVTLTRDGEETRYEAGERFELAELGDFQVPAYPAGIAEEIWERIAHAQEAERREQAAASQAPQEVLDWVERREAARQDKDWARADQIRDHVLDMGWQILDTKEGPVVEPRE